MDILVLKCVTVKCKSQINILDHLAIYMKEIYISCFVNCTFTFSLEVISILCHNPSHIQFKGSYMGKLRLKLIWRPSLERRRYPYYITW